MLDKIFGFSHVPPIIKGTAATTAGAGGVLIADGIINASTGPIIAGMVTVIGTAVIVVAGQLWGAANKAYAEREVIRTKAEVDRRAADLVADTAERAALLHDHLQREAEMREEIRQLYQQQADLRDKLEAEIRKNPRGPSNDGPNPGVSDRSPATHG